MGGVSVGDGGAGDGGADDDSDGSVVDPTDAADVPVIDAAPGSDAMDPCQPVPDVSYGTLSTSGAVTDRPAAEHADLNLALRGWSTTGGTLGLVDIDGPTDSLAPQLDTVFADHRVPAIAQNYRVNNWNWDTNQPAGPITDWEVTLIGVVTTPGEILGVPDSGYDIGEGMDVRVLYADSDSITLKYTREDNVVYGYTAHIEGLCVEPTLLALYQSCDDAGRGELPALAGGQPIGRARTAETKLVIRDTGAFMDPRARKDWWQDH